MLKTQLIHRIKNSKLGNSHSLKQLKSSLTSTLINNNHQHRFLHETTVTSAATENQSSLSNNVFSSSNPVSTNGLHIASSINKNTIAAPLLKNVTITNFACEKSAVEKVSSTNTGNEEERAFFINDVGVVERQYNRWTKNLPKVRPFYAVKCNPDDTLLRVLASMGAGFDCASGEEMNAALALGTAPEDIIFANPIKNAKDLRYAASMGVKKMTFDNIDELYKIKEHHPNCELVLRLLADDSGSVMKFGTKFGAPQQHVEKLLTTAHKLGLKVIGTSFHIGSGCFDANSYEKAIALSRSVFDKCESLGLPKMTFLDLGGGFPGNPIENEATGDTPAFETFAGVIRTSLDKYFPEGCGVQIIGEPGRYMATAWSTLFTLVQGKREVPVEPSEDGSIKRKFLYYINDGVYGSFNCIMFDHAEPQPIPAYRFMKHKLTADEAANAARVAMTPKSSGNHHSIWSSLSQYEPETMSGVKQFARAMSSEAERDAHTLATFFGPTCDSMDVIAKDVVMEELFVGDWVAFEQMGAYTGAAASTFNGMAKPTIHFVRSKQPSPIVA